MENIIKNIHLIEDREATTKLEALAAYHKRFSRIIFKIKEILDQSITIQVVQEKSPHENYATAQRLIEITHELFDPFFIRGFEINVHPVPYNPPPILVVDHKWITKKMKELNITTKELVHDTGIAKAEISSFTSGIRPLSDRTKGLFYYYFKSKEQQKLQPELIS